MKNMTEEVVKAKKLLADDYILIAGSLYRISKVKKDKTSTVMIQAFPVTMFPERKITLYVERKVIFIIYNQI